MGAAMDLESDESLSLPQDQGGNPCSVTFAAPATLPTLGCCATVHVVTAPPSGSLLPWRRQQP